MHWRDYYYQICPKRVNLLITYFEKRNFIQVALFVLLIYYAINGFDLVYSLPLLIFILISFLYFPVLLRFIYLNRRIFIHLNRKSYYLGLNQKALHETHNEYKNPRIFFLTAKKHSYSKKIEEEIAYIEAHETYLLGFRKYQPKFAVFGNIIMVFLLTVINLWALIYFIDTSSIKSPNMLFFVSVIFILKIIRQGYQTFFNKFTTKYYSELKKKVYNATRDSKIVFHKVYTDLAIEDEGTSTTDMIGVVVGVLFSLYVTLLFSKIYPSSTESKIIIDKNVTQYYIENITAEKRK